MDEKDFSLNKDENVNDAASPSDTEDISFTQKPADKGLEDENVESVSEEAEAAAPAFDLIDDAPEADSNAAETTSPAFDLIDDAEEEPDSDEEGSGKTFDLIDDAPSDDADDESNEASSGDNDTEVSEDDGKKSAEAETAVKAASKSKKTSAASSNRKPKKKTSSSKKTPVASAKKKKTKKKAGPGVNNSIFGGLILVTIILTASLVLAVTGIKISFEYLGVGKSEDNITFNIPENSTPDQIADILINYNIIENKTLFKIAMKFQHSPTLFPGDVTLNPAMGYATIIENLSYQRDIKETVTITFPEGVTLLEVANTLEEKKVIKKKQDFLFEFNKPQDFSFETLIDTNSEGYYAMEGFFFPDTYEFYVDDTGYNVTRVVKSNFADKYTTQIMTKLQQQDLSLSEVITLASIVQWEANSVEDMPKVASVFINRLKDPVTFPKLQSDATSRYFKQVINNVADTSSKEHYKDLYDTYVCDGLPAGPICNPGLDAILAVLEPADTNYYYFCNNLQTGESFFAETLGEHEENLIKAGLA